MFRFLWSVIFALFLSIGPAIYANQLSDITVSFCDIGQVSDSSYDIVDNGDTLIYMIDTNKNSPLCYTISNSNDSDVNLKISFVDGTFTNDEWKNRACLSDDNIEYFGKYVSDHEEIIRVAWNTQETYTATMNYPAWYDGIYQWCLVYSILEAQDGDTTDATNFSIVMRRAKFIDVLVGDYTKVWSDRVRFVPVTSTVWKNLSKNPYIRIYQDPADQKYVLQFSLKNEWNFNQEVTITGTVKNFLNNKVTFTESRIISKEDTVTVNKKLDAVPSYNMAVSIDIAHQIHDTFPGLEGIDTKWQFSANTNIIIMDTVSILTVMGLLIIIILIILVIILARRKKRS